MGFPTDMFPVLFTIPRVAGWIAHWVEFLADGENNIYRPRQNYTGHRKREFVDFSKRPEHKFETEAVNSKKNKRREAAQSYKESK
jgi:citrate synthase